MEGDVKMGEVMIEVEHLSKSFREQSVLKDINVVFEQGKIYGIIGRNGSGKSMLFKCICGLIRPTQGRVLICGREIGKDMDMAPDTGMLIEGTGFLANYNAYRNLKFLTDIRRKIGKQQILDALKIVGLEGEGKKKVGKFSMGMKQRLGIAQAIVEEQKILILDEPMNGLDHQGVEEMRKLLLTLKEQGRTILVASHNKEDIQILCDKVYEMDNGKLSDGGRLL